jgi:hypothetical protein
MRLSVLDTRFSERLASRKTPESLFPFDKNALEPSVPDIVYCDASLSIGQEIASLTRSVSPVKRSWTKISRYSL